VIKIKLHGLSREFRLLAWVSISLLVSFGAAVAMISANAPQVPLTSPVRIALRPLDFVPELPKATAVADVTAPSEAVKDLLAEHRCLSEVMYYEARGEGEEGERAVAEVVFDRLAAGDHGKTLCDVVYEGVGKTFCQFTFACDGSMRRPKNRDAWRSAEILAARLMVGELGQIPDIQGATNYHAAYAHPSWASRFDELAKIGNHIFYRAKSVNSPSG
jgi:spore germination cell wall hydrolase CwlJ-like protein